MNHYTTDIAESPAMSVLSTACAEIGLDAGGAELVRLGENALYRIPGGIVTRIARPGQHAAAEREVRIAAWLADNDVPAVRPSAGVDQSISVVDRVVTFWEKLPPHRAGTPTEVADVLRRLNSLAPPTGFHPAETGPLRTHRLPAALTATIPVWLDSRCVGTPRSIRLAGGRSTTGTTWRCRRAVVRPSRRQLGPIRSCRRWIPRRRG